MQASSPTPLMGELRWARERADSFRGDGRDARLVGVILDITAARGGPVTGPLD